MGGHGELAYLYNHLGLEDLAARELRRAFEIDPTSDELKGYARLMYEVQSNYDAYAADQSIRLKGRSEVWYFMGKGQLDQAQKAIDEWTAKSLQPLNDLPLAPTKALLSRKRRFSRSAKAVEWLREAAVSGYHLYPRYQRDAYLDRIRQAPEFIEFLAEMKAENDRYRHEFS